MTAYLARLATILTLITPIAAFTIYTAEAALDSSNPRLGIALALAALTGILAAVFALLPRT